MQGPIQNIDVRGGGGDHRNLEKKLTAVVSKIWRVKRDRRKIEIVDGMIPIIN